MHARHHAVLYTADRFHAAFPSIARFSDGHLLLAFRRGRESWWLLPEEQRRRIDPLQRMDHIDSRSHIVLMELDAEGEAVCGEPDILPMDPEAGDQDPSLLVLPDDRVFLASFSWYPLPGYASTLPGARCCPGDEHGGCRHLFWGAHTSLRERRQGDWVAHHRYVQPDGGYGHGLDPAGWKQMVGSVRGQALWHEGRILLPLYGDAHMGCALFGSEDLGATWQNLGCLAVDPDARVTYQEPALCGDGGGGLVCFMRTAGAGGRLAASHALDGRNWLPPRLHGVIGHPFHPLPLSDGRILLTYGYRQPPYGIRARLLETPLTDPDLVPEYVLRDDGLCPDLGYPWAVQLPDGRVLVVYYWTDRQGRRLIASTLLEVDKWS